MKCGKVILVIMLLSLTIIVFFPRQISACSCANPESVKDELNRKTAVFSGKVIDLVDKNKYSYIKSSADLVQVLFEVNESWKGTNASQVIVSTARSGASCGYEFELNKEYIVYAYGDKDNLETGFCERTALLSEASEDLDILGKGKAPSERVDLQEKIEKSKWVLSIAIVGGCIILGLVTIIIAGRMKKS
ncbi:hypothetical protein ACLM5H_13795 [Fredinandcohnia humi]